MLKYLTAVCLMASWLFSAAGFAAEPVNHAAALAPFLSQDSFAVAYADIAALDLPKDKEAILTPQMLLMLQSLPSDLQAKLILAAAAQGFAVRFRDAGGQGIYVLAGLGDVHIDGGPVVIATAIPGRRPEEVEQLFGVMIRELAENPSNRTLYPFLKQLNVKKQGSAVLVGMKGTVARYADMKSTARNDLIAPLERIGRDGAVASAVFCPGPDFRRVVRELWPQLPGSLAPLRGDLADRWLSVEVAVSSPTNLIPRLMLEARDAESAEVFAKLWQNLPAETAEFGGNDKAVEQVKDYAKLLVATMPAKVEGVRVRIGMSTEKADASNLGALFGKALDAAMESSQRRERADRFKDIALGLLNYESARKHLPAAAICDKDGRPLLSWRVAILPYIEQQALYKEFHLDEPWDSPHNSALIGKMPGIYMDLGSQADQLNHEGKTTCQVPTGPATVFYNKTGTMYREIIDGTANTILVVEVEPRRAVVWTKPEDWEVDLQHPRRGVERSDRKQFVAAWCDGSVQYVPVDADEAHLRAVLTRAGSEAADSHF